MRYPQHLRIVYVDEDEEDDENIDSDDSDMEEDGEEKVTLMFLNICKS